jgi:nicotinamide-nucleotide amidase
MVQDWLVIDDDMTISRFVAKLLKERKKTVGTAESCTGWLYCSRAYHRYRALRAILRNCCEHMNNQVKEGHFLAVSTQTIESAGQ